MLPALDFSGIVSPAGMAQLGQIILGDLTMAGDNVVIMGTIAASLPARDRRKVLMLGVGIALIFLIGFAVIATQLLRITGLLFAGGLLLLWVAYNMFRELRVAAARAGDDPGTVEMEVRRPSKSFLMAAIQITLADLSMSLDNVLLVASIARDNPALLFIGLTFSVLLMGFAANYVARLVQRHHWISWIGLAVILYVALNMIYEGWIGDEHIVGLRSLLA